MVVVLLVFLLSSSFSARRMALLLLAPALAVAEALAMDPCKPFIKLKGSAYLKSLQKIFKKMNVLKIRFFFDFG